MTWVAEPERWPRLAAKLRAAGEFGIDAETYGQPDRTSPQWRAVVHCWSVAVLGGKRDPRGYRRANGAVLPAAALGDPAIRDLLADPMIRKWAHNAPHDYHALVNAGLEVAGLEDSLQWLRVAVPGQRECGLKAAEIWALGKAPRPGFLELVTHPVEVTRVTHRTLKRCACGTVPCRARSTTSWIDPEGTPRPHTREAVRVPTEHTKMATARWDVRDFMPGHERWLAWLEYSLADAVSGIELVDWLRNRRVRERAHPWRSSCSSG